MYCEGICVQIFTYSVIEVSVGLGSIFHEYKKVEKNVFSCMLTIVITHVCILEHLVDRNMQESCKNALHWKCLKFCSMKFVRKH